jgi:hypothetical protein
MYSERAEVEKHAFSSSSPFIGWIEGGGEGEGKVRAGGGQATAPPSGCVVPWVDGGHVESVNEIHAALVHVHGAWVCLCLCFLALVRSVLSVATQRMASGLQGSCHRVPPSPVLLMCPNLIHVSGLTIERRQPSP